MIEFILNDKAIKTNVEPGVTVLDFVRYDQQLRGTKIGCREGDCGACTVLVGGLSPNPSFPQGDRQVLRYRSATSCLMALGNANGKHIVTIEGINVEGLNPIQQAMSDEGATQCGFCTPGFVMSLAGYCLSDKERTEKNAVACIDGNICRCTGYKSIERAALRVNDLLANGDTGKEKNIFPSYFSTIKERLQTLAVKENQEIKKSENEACTFLSGGTDLYVQKHEAMTHTDIRFLFDKKEHKEICTEGSICYVGAACTVTDLMESEIIQKHFAQFNKYAKLVSSTPIRNIATLAGNFVNASPIGDFTIFFLVLNAQLVLSDGKNKREVPLRKFYKAYKTLDKKPEEFIERFYFELPDEFTVFNFEKVSKRTHLDIASVNTAMKLKMSGANITEASISAGGVFAFPKFLEKASEFLKGKNISEQTISGVIEIAQTEVAPISDARGSEEYKRLLLSQLIKAHFVEMFPDSLKPAGLLQ